MFVLCRKKRIGKRRANMLQCFYPTEYVDSTYVIDFETLYQKGYRGIIFDIDNTLVPHGADADERSICLFNSLHAMGYKTILLSNNKEPRVKSFCEQVGSSYIYKAGKPLPKGYLEGIRKMGIKKQNTIFVGDQIFTDVFGAKRAEVYTILVKPIHPKEEIQIVLKRYLEKIVLHFYLKEKRKISLNL